MHILTPPLPPFVISPYIVALWIYTFCTYIYIHNEPRCVIYTVGFNNLRLLGKISLFLHLDVKCYTFIYFFITNNSVIILENCSIWCLPFCFNNRSVHSSWHCLSKCESSLMTHVILRWSHSVPQSWIESISIFSPLRPLTCCSANPSPQTLI